MSDLPSKLVTSDSIRTGISQAEEDELNTLFETKSVITEATRIAILSDIHSNMEAFEAVLDDMKKETYDLVLSLGDLVGYYTNPNEVVDASRDLFDFRVMGNHDFAAIEPEDLMFSTLNQSAQTAISHNKSELSDVNKTYLAAQPMKLEIETPHGSITAVHGDPLTIFGYIYGKNQAEMEEEIIKALSHVRTDYLLVGHTHIQGYYRSEQEKIYLNPGAVGQPRDRDNRAAYAILDLKTKEIELKRVEYDISSVQSKVHQCSFPSSLGDRLSKGE